MKKAKLQGPPGEFLFWSSTAHTHTHTHCPTVSHVLTSNISFYFIYLWLKTIIIYYKLSLDSSPSNSLTLSTFLYHSASLQTVSNASLWSINGQNRLFFLKQYRSTMCSWTNFLFLERSRSFSRVDERTNSGKSLKARLDFALRNPVSCSGRWA